MRDGAAEAQQRDTQDELAPFRAQFYLEPGQIYLDGNSLGLLSRPAEASLLRTLEDWKRQGVEGWTAQERPWLSMAEELSRLVAPLLGAEPEAVILTNATTVNLHQLLATLFVPTSERNVLLSDTLDFPSDLYALRSHLPLRGLDPERHLRLIESRHGYRMEESDLLDALAAPDVALAVFSVVLFRSGQRLNVERLTDQAHRHGVLIGFDCSHSIGIMPHQLDAWGVDFAFWCGYKYLSGGPGATGGLYLNRRHFGRNPGLAGWFGSRKEKQFEMSIRQDPAPNAGALQIGTPNVLSLAPLRGTLELFAEAGIERIRQKSLALTEFLMEAIETEIPNAGFTFANPRNPTERGGHVALIHPEAAALCEALKTVGVIGDYRPPDILRLAPTPFFTTFQDCYDAVQRLKEYLRTPKRVETTNAV